MKGQGICGVEIHFLGIEGITIYIYAFALPFLQTA